MGFEWVEHSTVNPARENLWQDRVKVLHEAEESKSIMESVSSRLWEAWVADSPDREEFKDQLATSRDLLMDVCLMAAEAIMTSWKTEDEFLTYHAWEWV